MRFNVVFFILFLGFLYLSLAQGSYEDCCLRYVSSLKPHIQKRVSHYRRQVLDGSCNIPAIVFTLRRGKVVCANPKEQWVQKLTQKIDSRMQKESVQGQKLLARKHSRS